MLKAAGAKGTFFISAYFLCAPVEMTRSPSLDGNNCQSNKRERLIPPSLTTTLGECIYSDTNAKRVKFLYDQGHEIASHTWRHKDLTTLSRAEC